MTTAASRQRHAPGRSGHPARRRAPTIATSLVLAGACLHAPGTLAAINCSTTVPGLAFGGYDPTLPAPTDITSSMTVTCTRAILDPWSVSYSVELSTGSSGSYATRRMNAGTARLNYNVYTNASRSQVWGNGTSSTTIVSTTMSFNFFQFSKSATHTAYGRIPAGQSANPGNFGDNLVVTLTF